MQLQFASGAVRLGANQILRLQDAAGATVCAERGTVWITEENQVRDVVLNAGHCYRLRTPGVAVVNALSGEASVSLQALIRQARRDRAEAMHRLIVAPVKRWLGLGNPNAA
ncbi:MAG TPA: DUF2917 domain-containing protein [Burkholderiales bacterium]|nr:DUF2917 domain-containing protein [Burkholderiales bacterium]